MKVVILSGHSEFDYARAAVRLGVRNYLLKPARPDELIEVITQIRDEILSERSAEQARQAGALSEHLDLIRSHYLSELVSGGKRPDGSARKRYADVGLRFDGGGYRVLLIDVEDYSCLLPGRAGEQLRALQETVRDAFLDQFEPSCRPNAFWTDDNRLCAILNLPKAGDHDTVEAMTERFQALASARSGIRVRVSLGNRVEAIGEIPAAYARLERSNRYSPAVAEAIQYVAEHFGEEIMVSAVADYVHVTPNHFSRVFTQETGAHFIDYLNKYRVGQAKLLLSAKKLRTGEVAEKCGYPDYKYFSYIFNKYVGCSPRRYVERLEQGLSAEETEDEKQ